MPNKKWFAPILPYLAVWAGLFLFKNAWFTLLGFHVVILIALVIMRPGIPIKSLFKSNSPKWILISLLVCSTSGIGLYLFWNQFGITPNLRTQLESLGLASSSWVPFITYFSLVNPFIEEYFWRGALGSDIKSLFVIDPVYAGYHVLVLWGRAHPVSILLAFAILVSAGWLWRQISRESGGFLAAVLGHIIADFSILTTVYWICTSSWTSLS